MKIAAPAKINLALHVTGQRPDGYHLIESLVDFADVGDVVSIEAAEIDSLRFSGPFGPALSGETGGNLVTKARDALRASTTNHCPPVAIHLEKNLPLSSGIGGGSADAAATLKGLNDLWQLGLTLEQLCTIGLTLGADLPMCLHGRPLIAKGIGEIIESVDLPPFHMLLVNPGVSVSTPAIFKALAKKENGSLPPIPYLSGVQFFPDFSLANPSKVVIPGSRSETRNPEVRNEDIGRDGLFHPPAAASHQFPISGFRASLRDPGMTTAGESVVEFSEYLHSTRNDLQPPALILQPVIADVIAALETSGAQFARMSGSGATCFGVFVDSDARFRAKSEIAAIHSDWWIS